MSELKCPFCQQDLDCMGKYTDGSSKWLCNKCGLFGDKKLFDEIIRTRKALEIAVDALNKIDKQLMTGIEMTCQAKTALDEIKTTLEQKDVK